MKRGSAYFIVAVMAVTPLTAWAAPPKRATTDIRAELAAAKAQIAAQQQALDAQEQRLRALEARIVGLQSPAQLAAQQQIAPTNPTTGANTRPAPAIAAAQGSAASTPGDPASVQQAPLERVGQAAPGSDRPPEVAVLGSGGSVVTRKGQLTAEFGAEYARADRNQAIFRGIEIVPTVLVGVFNISENSQDIMTLSGSARYGVTDKLELGVRLPFVHRANNIVGAPVNGGTTTATAAQGTGLGDIELSARYQFVGARGGWPYLIGNLQVVAPTGTDPFNVPRSGAGDELKAATGSGFWGVSPSLTAILPSDPAVLFGTIGYTRNFGRSFGVQIGNAILDYVRPGDALSFSGGIGISLNQRTSINLGYAHSWAFGTKTIIRNIDSQTRAISGPVEALSRNLQVGRFLFGMTYRVSDRASVNWSVEVGATRDATGLRSVLRIPLILLSGG